MADAVPTEGKLLAGLVGSYSAWKYLDGKYHLGHDLAAAKRLLPMLLESNKNFKTPGWSIVDMWLNTYKRVKRSKVALIKAETGETWTFQAIEEKSNQIAQWAAKLWAPNATVAIYMENDPLYVILWLGMAKAGVVVALLNNNILRRALVHSAKIAGSQAIIFDQAGAEKVNDVAAELAEAGVAQRFLLSDLMSAVASLPAAPVDAKARRAHIKSASHPFGYIYTSGTTGLPKACKISHMKMSMYSSVLAAFHVDENDVVYGSGMPLYHTAANLGTMYMLRVGSSYVVRKKFSARNHWKDCKKYKCTAMQYIGELCRYLLAGPPTPEEKQHNLRIAIGNGLRPEIWDQFQKRCNLPEIGEFYGATEGNAFTMNHCKEYKGQGAVGKQGPLLALARPTYIVKFDVETEEPVRDPKTGFCIPVPENVPGELISPIKALPTPAGQPEATDFEGYTSKEATEKKVLRNVFKKGDQYFRTGDLLRRKQGYTYFVDRIGDTFRWKGENVSTMEVSEVLSTFPGVTEASVYGVQIPKKDGRACMVAVTLAQGAEIDPQKFATYCRANLPSYSVPLFIRFNTEMDTTGTFKHKKASYKKEGFDPAQIKDVMWYLDIPRNTYAPLNKEAYQRLTTGVAKL
eukprot:TRINITY_DN740_c0_g1_i1.p2 TRINITY_DN740_c0_g1~~TRINITY_DN740_c0_g1_i1.p2  ORF type:complete len:631 (+),score=259.17 TRINITY_DN740_c0_g1_i1:54-1946(+)